MKKPGRCTDGFERGSGTLYHALPVDNFEGSMSKALCGTRPGRRTPGWSEDILGRRVSCKRCLAKLDWIARHEELHAKHKELQNEQ